MKYGKWISGALGWVLGGPIGAILGYSLGALLDSSDESRTGGPGNAAGGEQRNSFLVSLLVLSSSVMKADGKVMRSELNYVKEFLLRNFGEAATAQSLKILQELLKKEIDLPPVCAQIKLHMDAPQRLQLLHYLTGIARADDSVSTSELAVLRKIALYLGISVSESESIFAMFEHKTESAYRVLELTPEATDEEVKKAYKRLAMLHHPDKVESLGPDVRKAAEEKFKSIVSAYEAIRKERGMK